MATAGQHGGARAGAGRKKKPLLEKQAEPRGHRPITKLALPESAESLGGEDMPPVSDYMNRMAKNIQDNLAPKIYEEAWRWLKARGCETFVKKELIEQYALAQARWIQCEEGIGTYGLLAKHPTTGAPITSPYVNISVIYLKTANQLWNQIFQIVKENASVAVTEKSADNLMMEQLLRGKY